MRLETKQSLAQMASALELLNKELEAELAEMQRLGLPPSKIEHVRAGVKAIKDCGNMLLIWSDYIARGEVGDTIEDPESRPDAFPR
jgi:prefoldin subunit 5